MKHTNYPIEIRADLIDLPIVGAVIAQSIKAAA